MNIYGVTKEAQAIIDGETPTDPRRPLKAIIVLSLIGVIILLIVSFLLGH